MAKRVTTTDNAPDPAPEPKPIAGKKPKRKAVAIHAWVRPDVGAAFQAYLTSLRPTPTATSAVELALEEFLQKRGFWPPA